MAKSSHKSKTTSTPSVSIPTGYSGDGTGASFITAMESDFEGFDPKALIQPPTPEDPPTQGYDNALLALGREKEAAEAHLVDINKREKELQKGRKWATRKDELEDEKSFCNTVKWLWGDTPSMEDLRGLAFTSRNELMLNKIKSFKG